MINPVRVSTTSEALGTRRNSITPTAIAPNTANKNSADIIRSRAIFSLALKMETNKNKHEKNDMMLSKIRIFTIERLRYLQLFVKHKLPIMTNSSEAKLRYTFSIKSP